MGQRKAKKLREGKGILGLVNLYYLRISPNDFCRLKISVCVEGGCVVCSVAWDGDTHGREVGTLDTMGEGMGDFFVVCCWSCGLSSAGGAYPVG